MPVQMSELDKIAERIITVDALAFTLAIADFAASHDSESKRNRLRIAREALKQAIVKALAECSISKTDVE